MSIGNLKKIEIFKAIVQNFEFLEISKDIFELSANVYSKLRKTGKIIEDADILIGSICIYHNVILITNNEKHFNRIEGLVIENWV